MASRCQTGKSPTTPKAAPNSITGNPRVDAALSELTEVLAKIALNPQEQPKHATNKKRPPVSTAATFTKKR
jgi:hypothetical protein